MLIEFRVANFRSFNEEQTLSLVAGRDDAHPGNLIPHGKSNLLKAVAVYGPNASGKSNLIKAIRCMRSFIVRSATKMNQGDRIPGIVPFRLDPESEKQPSRFEVTMLMDGVRYRYGFSATARCVHEEWLNACPKGKEARWLERRFVPDNGKPAYSFRGPLEKDGTILSEKTRENCLVLSRGAELNVKPLAELYQNLRREVRVRDMSTPPSALFQATAKRVKKDAPFRGRVARLLRHADLGIEAIRVKGTRRRALPRGVRREILLYTIHHPPGSEAGVEFDFARYESNGTQRFFALAGPFLAAMDKGSVIVLDELECSMHPLLTRKLIELFQSPDANKNGAQLIFATHDSTLMDPELFRRDQIWLCEKNRNGATELFSLYDFDSEDRPRSTTAFQRNYLAGRFGGVPKLGPTFEDLELK